MADTSIANLDAVAEGLLAQEVPTNDSGTTRKLSFTQLMELLQPGDSEASPGTSTTSATLVDTSIVVPLDVGVYSLLGAGLWSSAAGGLGLRFGCDADGGLVVSEYVLIQTVMRTNTGAQVGWATALGSPTLINNGGGATVRPWLLQGCIVVTTAGNLKLQIASETAGQNVTMVDGVFQAFRI